jgi:hypothetical protein
MRVLIAVAGGGHVPAAGGPHPGYPHRCPFVEHRRDCREEAGFPFHRPAQEQEPPQRDQVGVDVVERVDALFFQQLH